MQTHTWIHPGRRPSAGRFWDDFAHHQSRLRGRHHLPNQGPCVVSVLRGVIRVDVASAAYHLPAQTRLHFHAAGDACMTTVTPVGARVHVASPSWVADSDYRQPLIEDLPRCESVQRSELELEVEEDHAKLLLTLSDRAHRLPGNRRAARRLLTRLITARNAVYMDPGTSTHTMAEQAALSYGHFISCFRAAFGIAPGAHLKQVRMRLAKAYLLDDFGTMAEIAEACGYEDRSAMSRAFKRCFGVAPAIYRQREASRGLRLT